MKLKDFSEVQYINLVTYRRDNTPVSTAVWVAGIGDALYVTTGKAAGKVKRIKNNGKATIHETNQSGSQKLSEDLDLTCSGLRWVRMWSTISRTSKRSNGPAISTP